MKTEIEVFGYNAFHKGMLLKIEMTVPVDLIGHKDYFYEGFYNQGGWASEAKVYGPELQRLNPDVDMIMIRNQLTYFFDLNPELDFFENVKQYEYGIDHRNWNTEPDDIVWQCVSWILACERKERKDHEKLLLKYANYRKEQREIDRGKKLGYIFQKERS